MANHTINANLTVEVINPAALGPFGGGGDERAAVDAAVQLGLKELQGVAQRYGFRIVDAAASVS